MSPLSSRHTCASSGVNKVDKFKIFDLDFQERSNGATGPGAPPADGSKRGSRGEWEGGLDKGPKMGSGSKIYEGEERLGLGRG